MSAAVPPSRRPGGSASLGIDSLLTEKKVRVIAGMAGAHFVLTTGFFCYSLKKWPERVRLPSHQTGLFARHKGYSLVSSSKVTNPASQNNIKKDSACRVGSVGIAVSGTSEDTGESPVEADPCMGGTTNRPPLNTQSTIDWVSVTVPYGDSSPQKAIPALLARIGINADICVEMDRSNNREYEKGARYGHVEIYWQSRSTSTIHINATGQGCRDIEELPEFGSWEGWLGDVLEIGGKFTRLDVAFDDFSGGISPELVHEYRTTGLYTSRARYYRYVGSWVGESPNGLTAYVGSPKGRFQMRAYNKAAETGSEGNWCRVELQARHEKAQGLVELICSADGRGRRAALDVLAKFVQFREEGTDSNKSRWPLADWWVDFLAGAQGVALGKGRTGELSLDRSLKYLENQVAGTVARLLKAGLSITEIDAIWERRAAVIKDGDAEAVGILKHELGEA